jgi:protein phosphatase
MNPYLEYAGMSDIGQRREANEDAYICMPAQGVFCVADGIGGADAGALASRTLVEGLQKHGAAFTLDHNHALHARARLIQEIINDVSSDIKSMADNMGFTGTGTTAAILVFDEVHKDKAQILHAGDSSVYLYRDDSLQRLNRLHSLAESKTFQGTGPLPEFMKGMITRAVGVRNTVELEQTYVEVRPGDLFLICSDGLDGMISHQDIHRLLHDYRNDSLETQVQVLVDAANDSGGKDNITVILVRAGKSFADGKAKPAPAG